MDAGQPRLGLQHQGRALLKAAGLSARQVAELASELAPLVCGLTLEQLEALPPRDLVLGFAPAAPGARRRALRLSADPDLPRAHLQHARVARHRGPQGPFYRELEHELAGAELVRLAPLRADRILWCQFKTARGPRALVLELTGRRANMALLGADDRLLAVLDPPAPGQVARLATGAVYVPPPGARAPSDAGPSLAEELPLELAALDTTDAPLSLRIERVLGAQAAALALERARRSLRERLERRLERAQSFLRGVERRRAASEQAERVRMDGELLKSRLADIPRGARSIELVDWFADSAPRTIELDPKLSPQHNLEKLFERYHKLVRAAADLEIDLERGRASVQGLEALLAALAQPDSDPEQLESRAIDEALLDAPQAAPKAKDRPAPRLPYKVYRAQSGREIWVGRSATDNDELSLKHARGNDLWLHTADSPGSHVVLRLDGPAEPEPEDLLDAAHLAIHFSPLKGAAKADVHIARAKQVHKPRGAKPGLVHLSGGKTLRVRLEPARLRALLDTRPGTPEDA